MNKSKIRGTNFETAIVTYLKPHFPMVERRALAGSLDKGDIAGVPGWVLEAKDCKTITLSSFVDEAMIEKENAGSPFGAAVVKRRGKNVSQAYVVMPLEQFVELIK